MFEPPPPGAAPVARPCAAVSPDVLRPAPRPFGAFPPGPARPRPSLRRRALLRVGAAYQWLEVLLDRLVSSPLNPFYHAGTIAVFSLAVTTVTGIYLFVFYRVGTEAAHRSIEGIMAHPLGLGALVRSLHRYASDAAIVAAVVHGGKMLLNDRFSGARWIGWVSGLVLVGLVWVTGATGYWLIWDLQAQILSVTTARFLDVLPIFGEPLVRTFVDAERVQRFLFFLVLFVHISIPFLLGAVYWLHVMRLSRARFFPPRVVLWVTGAALVGASLLRPAVSGPPADLLHLPGRVPIDWFYFAYFPLTRLDPRVGWSLVFGLGLVGFSLPWWLRAPVPARARVDNPACTGCQRCWRDCPYEAVVMVPREDGGRGKQVAVVNPAKCVGCGICVGACDSAGILLDEQPVSLLGDAVLARLRAMRARHPDRPAILVFACRSFARLEPRLDPQGGPRGLPGVTVMGLPCVGALHPAMVTKALGAGASGVFVAGCVPEDCPFREGSQWLAERFAGRRAPVLKRTDDGRLRVRWYAPVETVRLLREVGAFQTELAVGASDAPAGSRTT
jgi:coenzyme F420-reducing hydrogenase delta subunit/ferredoxin